MDWTSLYLKTSDLNVFILGTGEVATRRANRFLDHGANVRLAGNGLSEELFEKGAELYSTDDVDDLVEWCDLAVVASGDEELSDHVSRIAGDKLINRADYPYEGNVIVPTSFSIGDVEISIFTNGKSPLMARQLRKKIQSIITDEDILEIELQDYTRTILKEKIENQKDRKEILYQTLNNPEIQDLLKNDKLEDAKKLVCEMLDENI